MNNRMKFIEARETLRAWNETMDIIDKEFPSISGSLWLTFAPQEVIEKAFRKVAEDLQEYLGDMNKE